MTSDAKNVKDLYNNTLHHIENMMGNMTTDTDELNYFGHLLLGDDFQGTFAKDENFNTHDYCIVNTDTSDGVGKHWVAIGQNKLYDSFARVNDHIGDTEELHTAGDSEPEQQVDEDNCGQRCLAWLVTIKTVGPKLIDLL